MTNPFPRISSPPRLVALPRISIRAQAPALILSLMLAHIVTGLAVWAHYRLTGDNSALNTFFRYPSAFFTLSLGIVETGLCWEIWRQFERGDSLRSGWLWLSFAAVAHLAGRTLAPPGSDQTLIRFGANLHQVGVALGGPVQMVLLLVGLTQLALHCRRRGLLDKLTLGDYALLAMVFGFALRTFYGIQYYLDLGNPVTWSKAVEWTSDPLLVVLLVLAVVIRRSMAHLGGGLLANCWRSYVVAIALTSLASASEWCLNCSGTPWWGELGWFVWFVADAAYALAPAFQAAAFDRLHARAEMLKTIDARA